ncbi:MAG: hypothetical protein WCJ09_09545 [Planctomycetota bacterium]
MPRSVYRRSTTLTPASQDVAGTQHSGERTPAQCVGRVLKGLCLCATIAIYGIIAGRIYAAEPAADWKSTQQKANTLVAACQFEQAVELLTGFIKVNPQFAPAYEQRAWVTLDWLDLRDELSLTDIPLRQRSFSDPASGLGNIDPPVEARRILLNDRFIEKYIPPAELKSVQQDLAECRKLAGKTFDDRPIESFIAEYVGDLDRAQQLLGTRCKDGTAKPREYLTQMRLSRVRGDVRGGLAAAEAAWKYPETRNQAASRKINLLRSQNRNREASDFFNLWEDTSPRDVRFLNVRTAISLEKTQVFKDFAQLNSLAPGEASLYYALSVRDIQINNDGKSCLTHLSQAVECSPNSLIPYYARCYMKLKLGDLKGALADANSAIQCNPDFDLSYQARSRVLTKMGDSEAAHADDLRRVWLKQLYTLHAAYKAKPENPETSYELGRHYANGEDWNMAVRALTTSLKKAPKNVNARQARSQVFVAIGKLDQALADADAAIAAAPDPAGFALRGDIFARRQDWDKAVKDYERSKLLDDRMEQALRKRAAWHNAAGRVEQAKADLERAGQASQASFVVP